MRVVPRIIRLSVPEYEKVFRDFFIAMHVKKIRNTKLTKVKHILGGL